MVIQSPYYLTIYLGYAIPWWYVTYPFIPIIRVQGGYARSVTSWEEYVMYCCFIVYTISMSYDASTFIHLVLFFIYVYKQKSKIPNYLF